MIHLRILTDGAVTGSDTVDVETRRIGGVLITADGTNDATVKIQNDSSSGETIFEVVTKDPLWVPVCLPCSSAVYYSVSGTGAKLALYEMLI